jgi:hypothetical protein
MTKENFIDEMIHYVGRVDKTQRVRPRVVEAAINGAVNSVMTMAYGENPFDVSFYTKTYSNVPITDDKIYLTEDFTSGAAAITLLPLPRVGGGVMAVRPFGDYDVLFFPMTISGIMSFSSMESSTFISDVGFVLRGAEMQFTNLPEGLSSVAVDLVRAFEAYDYDETLYLFGRDEQIKDLVLQKLGIISPVNLKNDNSDGTYIRQERSTRD